MENLTLCPRKIVPNLFIYWFFWEVWKQFTHQSLVARELNLRSGPVIVALSQTELSMFKLGLGQFFLAHSVRFGPNLSPSLHRSRLDLSQTSECISSWLGLDLFYAIAMSIRFLGLSNEVHMILCSTTKSRNYASLCGSLKLPPVQGQGGNGMGWHWVRQAVEWSAKSLKLKQSKTKSTVLVWLHHWKHSHYIRMTIPKGVHGLLECPFPFSSG